MPLRQARMAGGARRLGVARGRGMAVRCRPLRAVARNTTAIGAAAAWRGVAAVACHKAATAASHDGVVYRRVRERSVARHAGAAFARAADRPQRGRISLRRIPPSRSPVLVAPTTAVGAAAAAAVATVATEAAAVAATAATVAATVAAEAAAVAVAAAAFRAGRQLGATASRIARWTSPASTAIATSAATAQDLDGSDSLLVDERKSGRWRELGRGALLFEFCPPCGDRPFVWKADRPLAQGLLRPYHMTTHGGTARQTASTNPARDPVVPQRAYDPGSVARPASLHQQAAPIGRARRRGQASFHRRAHAAPPSLPRSRRASNLAAGLGSRG
eukprot:351609-Chlamydomonas_euryale.AAC.10